MAKMKSSTIMHDDRITHITHVTACWVHHATVRTRRGRIQRQRMHPHKVATSRRGAPPPALRRPPEPPRGVPRPHRRRRGRGAVQLHVEVGPAARVQHERRHGHALAALDGRDAGVEAVRVADGRGEGDERGQRSAASRRSYTAPLDTSTMLCTSSTITYLHGAVVCGTDTETTRRGAAVCQVCVA